VQAPKKIGLLNHMGGGNLGDDVTQTVVMHNIRKRWPTCEIVGLSMNPSDTQARHGIPSYPIRRQTWDFSPRPGRSTTTFKSKVKHAVSKCHLLLRVLEAANTVANRMLRCSLLEELSFLTKSFRITRSLDLVIISGGGQLLDSWGGPWKFPYTVFKWVLLARLSLAKCYFINVGAGPIAHPLGKYFVRCALLLAHYVSFRDEQSLSLVVKIGFRGSTHVVSDCVYGLDPPESGKTRTAGQADSIVGISPMAYCDPRVYWDPNQDVYQRLLRELACFGTWLTCHDHRVRLFSTDIRFDAQTIEELKMALKNSPGIGIPGSILHDPISTTEELLSQLHSLDYLITCRYHGVVFAHLMNVPVLALSHHLKVATLMNDFGLSEYCLDIRAFDSDLLRKTFIRLVANREDIKARMAKTVACYKSALALQFDALFPQELRNTYA
jgi:polysaccharide pyruvyl transferase WcaK-like protein